MTPTSSDARLPAEVPAAAVRAALGRDADDPVLRGAVDLLLASPLPMVYAHGPEHRLLYNRAYAELLGPAHPAAFGAPAREALPHSDWDVVGDPTIVRTVVGAGEGVLRADDRENRDDGGLVPDGDAVPRTWTRGHSPVRASDGRTTGMLTVAVETTHALTGLDRLSRLAAVLTGALSSDDVVRAALRHAVTELDVDYARLWLEDKARGGWTSVRRLADDVSDPATERLPLVWTGVTPNPDPRVSGVAERGEAVWLDELRPGDVAPADVPTVDGVVELDDADRALRSVALVPLEGTVGLLTLGRFVPRAFRHDERALLVSSTRLVGRALARARAFEEERGSGRLLQGSLLPDRLPVREDLVVAARHEAPGARGRTGGDFYDAFVVDDGQVALVVGDAMSHGAVAAAVTGQVRAALRALALADPSPAAVLSAGDRVFRSIAETNDAAPEGGFLTVAYVLLDPRTGHACAASAGHPAPAVRRADGSRLLDLEAGPPLGMPGTHPVVELDLAPGDLLLLYTDGLVERRGRPLAAGLEALVGRLDDLADADPYEVSARLLDEHRAGSDDDVAVLAVQRTGAPHRTAETVLPADTTAPRLARRWVAAQLEAGGGHPRSDDVEAAVTEVVTNTVLHARTPSRLSLRHGEGRVVVEVVDQGRGGPVEVQVVEADATRGRGLALVAEVTDAWGSQRTTTGQRVWFEVHDEQPVGRGQ
ncbi:ATP-binding SpoIIE family protein phosphatase [Aquipuribacter nitratireducens]|uniref:SpoIIE family protein phosphatase n=1 Tax=Aquipuribacter nitratireducens TaxID=650104 RepID=A0ABW0GR42_9MICO